MELSPRPDAEAEHIEILYLLRQRSATQNVGLLDRRYLEEHLTQVIEQHLIEHHEWNGAIGGSSLDEPEGAFGATHNRQ